MQVERSDLGLQSSDLGWYNTNMNDVSDLIIYQRALKLLEPIYRLAKMLPKESEENFFVFKIGRPNVWLSLGFSANFTKNQSNLFV